MKRAILALVLILAARAARADQTWSQNQHATNAGTGQTYSLDGLPAPAGANYLTMPVRPGDMPGAGLPCALAYTGSLPTLFRCATPADIPGATGTPNTVAWFNGSGLLNSLALDPSLALVAGTLGVANAGITTLKLADASVTNAKAANMPARSFKVNATNGAAAPSDLACTGAGQVPQDTGTALVCQQLNYSSLAGSPPAVTSGTGDVNFTGPGAAATTIQPNVVTNSKQSQMAAMTIKGNGSNATANPSDIVCSVAGTFLGNLTGTSVACQAVTWASLAGTTNAVSNTNLAQSPALTIKANGTNATANEQDLACSTAGTFLGNLTGTSLACGPIPASSTSGIIAAWPLTSERWYCVDGTNGNDANAGYSDTSEADCGTKAKKTIAGLQGVFPPNGAGRSTKVVIASGTYSDGLTFLAGNVGYQTIGVIGTGTQANAGAVAFDGSAATDIFAGGITVPGLNAAGYNPTGTPTTGAVTLQLNGGGAAGLPAEPAAPLGWRIRFDNSTSTVALRGICVEIAQVSGGNTITFGRALSVAPSTADVIYIEKAGVIVGTTLIAVGQDTTAVRIGGIDMGATLITSGNVIFSLSGTTTFNPQSPGVVQSIDIWQGNIAGPNIRMGGGLHIASTVTNFAYGTARWTALGGATFLGTTEILDPPGLFSIVDGSTFAAGVAIQGAQMSVQTPDQTDFIGSLSTIPVRVIGSGAYVGGTAGVVLRGTSLAFRAMAITGMGSAPAIRAIGLNYTAFIATVSGSAGNTDVGLDLTAAYGSTFVLSATPTVTGTAGDVRLCDGTIISWATAYAGIVDTCGNWIGNQAAYPWTTRRPVLSVIGNSTNTAGTVGNISATAGGGGVLREAGSTIGFGNIAESAVTNLTTDLAGKQPTGNYVTSGTGPVTFTGPGASATAINFGGGSITGTLALGNEGAPTGTGFSHVTTGTWDSVARAIDVSGADITNQLKATSFPALTGAVTTPGGSLATTLNLSASGSITGTLSLSFLAQGGATTNQVVAWNGSAWAPSTISTAPSGAAGGALTGTYPNPSIANGVIVPANFSAFPASTLFGNDQTSSAVPRTITLGSGLAFDPTGHTLFSTVAGGAPAAATYWVSSAASAPSNAVQMQSLGTGLLQQTVSSGVSTPSVLGVPAFAIIAGTSSGGTVTADSNFTINGSTHVLTANGSVSLQGGTTTIGNWSGMGTYSAGVVGAFSSAANDIPYGSGSGGLFTQSGNFQYDGGKETISSVGAGGVSLSLARSGAQAIQKDGTGNLSIGTAASGQSLCLYVGGSACILSIDGTTHVSTFATDVIAQGITAGSLVATDSGQKLIAAVVDSPLTYSGGHLAMASAPAYRDYFIDIPSLQSADTASRWLTTSSQTQAASGGVIEYGNTDYVVGHVAYVMDIITSSGTASSMQCSATRNGTALGGATLIFTPGATPPGLYSISSTSTGSTSTSDTYGMACQYNGNFSTGPFGATIAFTVHMALLP